MDSINEMELRKLLKKKTASHELMARVVRRILDPRMSWDEQRSLWFFLYHTGHLQTLAHALIQALQGKLRVPLDLYLEICTEVHLKPSRLHTAALMKGMRKQAASDEILVSRGWDRFDPRLKQMREELLGRKIEEQRRFKDDMMEKFEFLQAQRMNEQAGRLLRRMIEIFPEDEKLQQLKGDLEEQWAREVLANHAARMSSERLERTRTAPSSADEVMLKCFLTQGEAICLEHRQFASDLAVAFLFMEDYNRALEILAWAPLNAATDWMRVELLFAARRFVEALDVLNHLEIKYISDPESTFAVSYLRAQCLHALGQDASALEIMQSIVRARPTYRSAHALILEWTQGVSWD
ncbi:MAG: hypothetical protein AB7G93_16110 [Bdellovibrionales bacterium]